MNPSKSTDFKLTQSSEKDVERIFTLHGYIINITSVQPNTDRYFESIQKISYKYEYMYMYVNMKL